MEYTSIIKEHSFTDLATLGQWIVENVKDDEELAVLQDEGIRHEYHIHVRNGRCVVEHVTMIENNRNRIVTP